VLLRCCRSRSTSIVGEQGYVTDASLASSVSIASGDMCETCRHVRPTVQFTDADAWFSHKLAQFHFDDEPSAAEAEASGRSTVAVEEFGVDAGIGSGSVISGGRPSGRRSVVAGAGAGAGAGVGSAFGAGASSSAAADGDGGRARKKETVTDLATIQALTELMKVCVCCGLRGWCLRRSTAGLLGVRMWRVIQAQGRVRTAWCRRLTVVAVVCRLILCVVWCRCWQSRALQHRQR
jgi:hypothetical protein